MIKLVLSKSKIFFCDIICTQRGPIEELKAISFYKSFQIHVDIINHLSGAQSYLKAYLQGAWFWKHGFVFPTILLNRFFPVYLF